MNPQEALEALKCYTGSFPKEAVETAIRHLDELTPALLGILEDTLRNPRRVIDDPDYMAHTYAMYLLAQAREAKAYPLLARLAALPPEEADAVFGECIAEGLPQCLASTFNGDLEPIQALIENCDAGEFARASGLRALVTLLNQGVLKRETVTDYFLELLRGKLKHDDSYVWNELACCATDIHPGFCLEELRTAYTDGRIDDEVIGLDEIEKTATENVEMVMAKLDSRGHDFITDTVDAMYWWACFNEDWNDDDVDEVVEEPERMEAPPPPIHSNRISEVDGQMQNFVRDEPKVGRNDPCPCGSGKKFKKCCANG